MKTLKKLKLSKDELAFIATLVVLLGKKITKRQKKELFLMVTMPETTGAVKRLKCEYDKPGNISQLASYYLNFIAGMQEDTLFATIAALLTSAVTQVEKLRDEEVAMLGKLPGQKAIRDTEFLKTEIIMDTVLTKVQQAGDADIPNSFAIFSRHQLKIREYTRHETGELEVENDNGTFKVKCRRAGTPGSSAAYLWMISKDKVRWEVGEFRKKSSGVITKCGEEQLILGTKYYIKAMTDSNEGKSAYTQIVEKYCI